MSKIDFNLLVESILSEAAAPLINILTPPESRAGLGGMNLKEALEKAERYGFEIGKYEKNGTVIGFKTAWPYIDVLAFIYKTIVDSGLGRVPNTRTDIFNALQNPEVIDAETLMASIPTTPEKQDILPQVSQQIQQKINILIRDKENYKDYFINRFKQLNDKTATIAAERYFNMSPYDAIVDLLKEYGGYDISLAKKIVEYPGETDFTIKSGAQQDPVLATIVEISKLMLVFYREYVAEQKEVSSVISVPDLQVANVEELKQLILISAGKLNAPGRPQKIIQTDYINFTKGKSALAIDSTVPPDPNLPLDPPVPLIRHIIDFQGMTDTGQIIYETFLQLFNNIRKGTTPSGWNKLGQFFSNLFKGIEDIGDVLGKM